ncbi:polysaccharide biosynthesis/export family protein [Fibrella forsythiae]|uniref:Polysaccharide export protein n=1 Tax=Fibrella forsythiae TaxID=2817061 RepID=A0ABS3JHZ9_9BACT|nr:polysaccharide biosynthesis/export family protein [Fibrella forsythiae]MBO0949639.1 polysaccharide export protein [Fibrella forsythiae]
MSRISTLPVLMFLLAAVGLSGCASQNLFQKPVTTKIDSVFLGQASSTQYVIRKDDKLSISIWNHDDLSVGSLYSIYSANEVYGKWVMVDPNGDVPIPKIGKVKLAGLTQLQARDRLLTEFRKWIVDPIIDVKVLNKEVTILGELKNPGKFLLEKEANSLIELLGRAGDFDLYADRQAIQVIRTIDNQPHTMNIDLTRMDQFATRNIQILPGDVVYVPAKKSKLWDKRAGPSVLPVASAITTLLVLFKFFI